MEEKELKSKMNKLMYGLVKNAARESLVDFLEHWGLTIDDYDELMNELKEQYDIKPYC